VQIPAARRSRVRCVLPARNRGRTEPLADSDSFRYSSDYANARHGEPPQKRQTASKEKSECGADALPHALPSGPGRKRLANGRPV